MERASRIPHQHELDLVFSRYLNPDGVPKTLEYALHLDNCPPQFIAIAEFVSGPSGKWQA
jgi:hypothetical protein